jgi:hypothetical protein
VGVTIMQIRWPRAAVFALCTALSLPGAALGAAFLWSNWQRAATAPPCAHVPATNALPMLALLFANAFAWLAYLRTAAAWIADQRLSPAWPISGGVAALSYGLQLAGEPKGFELALGLTFVALVLVLPATLLSVKLMFFHLDKDSAAPSR